MGIIYLAVAGSPLLKAVTFSACIWQFGYILSEPLLIMQDYISDVNAIGTFAGGALGNVFCASFVLQACDVQRVIIIL